MASLLSWDRPGLPPGSHSIHFAPGDGNTRYAPATWDPHWRRGQVINEVYKWKRNFLKCEVLKRTVCILPRNQQKSLWLVSKEGQRKGGFPHSFLLLDLEAEVIASSYLGFGEGSPISSFISVSKILICLSIFEAGSHDAIVCITVLLQGSRITQMKFLF